MAAAGLGYAEGAVDETFDFDKVAGGAAEIFLFNFLADVSDHFEVEFAGEDDGVGVLGVEFDGFEVGNGELGGGLAGHTDFAAIEHGGDVLDNYGSDADAFGFVDDAAHEGEVVLVEESVEGDVAFDTCGAANFGDFGEFGKLEIAGGAGAHVQVLDAEVDAVAAGVDGGG